MKLFKSLLICFVSFIILTSGTCKKERMRLDSWLGSTKDQVIKQWGLPNRTSTDYNGGEVLVFSENYYYNGTTYYNHYLLFFGADGKMNHWLKQVSATPPQSIDLRITN